MSARGSPPPSGSRHRASAPRAPSWWRASTRTPSGRPRQDRCRDCDATKRVACAAMPMPTAELADRARAAGRLGIDTEFMGEGRYQPLLCLIQIALDDGNGGAEVLVLDPLTEDYDPAPLAEVLADPDVEAVPHASRHDVALRRGDWGTPLRNVFDTQV